MFKRKIYKRMKEWKEDSDGKTAFLIEGARRIGKSTVVEEFAKNEYASYILIDFSKVSKDIRGLFEDVSDLNYLFLQLQLGYMFGSGSSALISKSLGEGKSKEANRIFSTIVWVTLILGTLLATVGFVFLPTVATMLGAEGELLDFGLQYGRITLVFIPFVMFEYLFSYLLPTAEKPQIGMYFRIASVDEIRW